MTSPRIANDFQYAALRRFVLGFDTATIAHDLGVSVDVVSAMVVHLARLDKQAAVELVRAYEAANPRLPRTPLPPPPPAPASKRQAEVPPMAESRPSGVTAERVLADGLRSPYRHIRLRAARLAGSLDALWRAVEGSGASVDPDVVPARMVREWARSAKVPCPQMGPVPKSVMVAYLAARSETTEAAS